MKILLVSLLFLALGTALTPLAPNFVLSDSGDLSEEFGGAVAISGSTLVVGASEKSDAFQNQGAALVYTCTQSSCTYLTQLEAPDPADYDNFGYSVAVDGSMVVIGAPSKTVGSNEFQGAAYVYQCAPTGCSLLSKLVATGGMPFDDFGTSVSVSGMMVAVGADQTMVNGNEGQGTVYIFSCSASGCNQMSNFTCSNCNAGDLFGFSVSISGSFVTAGAPFSDVGSTSLQGQAYTFDCTDPTNCQELASFTTLSGGEDSYFGWAVTSSGWHALIASPFENGTMGMQGAVYPVDCTNGVCTQYGAGSAPDAMDDDNFGFSVSLNGNIGLIGANNRNMGKGGAYLFDCTIFSSCKEYREYGSSTLQMGDMLGSSVSLSGNFAAVGAPFHMGGTVGFYGAPAPVCSAVVEGNAQWPKSSLGTTVYGACMSGYTGKPFRMCQLDETFGPISQPCVQNSQCPSQDYGHVLWPVTNGGSYAMVSCDAGYSSTGTPTRFCQSSGTWSSNIQNNCKINTCPAITEGNANWVATNALMTASGTCMSGYSGTPTRMCNADGTWGSISGACSSTTCPAEVYGHATFSQTAINTMATGVCGGGYSGTVQRRCQPTGWSTSISPTCTRITCPATTSGGATFQSALSNTAEKGSCPNGSTGSVKGTCDANGNWSFVGVC